VERDDWQSKLFLPVESQIDPQENEATGCHDVHLLLQSMKTFDVVLGQWTVGLLASCFPEKT
jgi:hypothetical protein